MTDQPDRPYVERQGGSFVRQGNGKLKRVAGTVERDGPEHRPTGDGPKTAATAAETSEKVK